MPSLGVAPGSGPQGNYLLTPGSTVGSVTVGDLSIEIRPKIPIDRLLFLAAYTLSPKTWRDWKFDYGERHLLLEAIIPGFVFQVKQAIRRGLLQGYRSREETLAGVKGRIRFDDQLRKRFGIVPPIEVTYDDYTEDITENQILRAAIERLTKLRIRNQQHRISLNRLLPSFERVADLPLAGNAIPDISYSRLNEHYRPSVELARLILRATSFDLAHGRVRSSGFLIDMNKLFEDFLVVALRETLGLSLRAFPQNAKTKRLYLDEDRTVRLEPDFSWWQEGRCLFVGDAKYKDLSSKEIRHNDLYQLLAYLTATNLPSGLLVYAAGKGSTNSHWIPLAGKTLIVQNLDLTRSPDQVLAAIGTLAGEVRRLAGDQVSSKAKLQASA